KMNQTLQDLAQALFKSWFVDFEPTHALANKKDDEDIETIASNLGISKEVLELFPSEFEDSELGMIPKGWGIEKFGNTVEKYIDNRGKTPPTVESGIPLLEVRNMPDDMLTSNPNVTKFVTEETYNTWFRSHLEANDILISTVGTIGKTSIMPQKAKIVIAQNVLGLRFKSDILESQFMFYQMKHKKFLHAIDARLVITVQASIKRKDLDTIDVIIPPKNIQKLFIKQIQPIIEKQQSNENINLEKIRDTLLPKLLSGELEV
ncbi:MAG: restriction endonuclease subunit S, partial [Campylobacterota bacterium]|nr:restriction endonuclease subunit S [Campylobacterota bacterium]